jgi:cytoskeletal protein CcmA (bactofilin family)
VQVSELTAVERRVWDASLRGDEVDLRTGDSALDDPAAGDGWGPERTVRAEALIMLLLGAAAAAEPGHVPALRLEGVRIEGKLDCDHAEIPFRVWIRNCDLPGGVNLSYATTRQFGLTGSRVAGLSAYRANVDGTLRMAGCRFTGEVLLESARIAGSLNLDGAVLTNPGGKALAANRIQVDDYILLREGFSAHGAVELRGAQVGGDLDLTGATLENPAAVALCASRIRVEGSVLCDKLEASGEIQFNGAVVAGEISVTNARLRNPGKTAFSGHDLQLGENLDGEGLEAQGGVDLRAAKLGGVALGEARIDAPGAVALDLWQAEAKSLDLRTAQAPAGVVDLRHAVIGILHDEQATWPAELRLDGLRYDGLAVPMTATIRRSWLSRDPDGYCPQPYEFLAQTFRALGYEDDARTAMLAKERQRHSTLPWYANIWGAIQDVTVGYGYRPTRAGVWLVGLLALGTTVFSVFQPVRDADAGTEVFDPVVFTLERLLPFLDFGQATNFTPTSGTQWFGYALTGSGWLIATTIATGVTRSINRL